MARARSSNTLRQNAIEAKTLALSTLVTRPAPSLGRARRCASRNAKSQMRSGAGPADPHRVVDVGDHPGFAARVAAAARIQTGPRCFSRTSTRSMPCASGLASGVGKPLKVRIGRTPAYRSKWKRRSSCGMISVPSLPRTWGRPIAPNRIASAASHTRKVESGSATPLSQVMLRAGLLVIELETHARCMARARSSNCSAACDDLPADAVARQDARCGSWCSC